MDQLEILKKDWNRQESTFPKLTQHDLSGLIHKKSSSIVKWIFIISILEIVLPILLSTISGIEKTSMEGYKKLGLSGFVRTSYIVYYIIIIYFVYRFYKNYKSISVYSNPKELLQNILNTRKIVKYYIWFNLAITPIITGVILYKTLNSPLFADKITSQTSMAVIVLLSFLLMAVVIAIFWLFYKLLYGILLNKLEQNYNELVTNNNC